MRVINRWTEGEDNWLREHCPSWGARKCCAEGYLDRTYRAIEMRASRLGLHCGNPSSWSDEEVEILKRWFPVLGKTEFLARGLLDRSQRAIESKAYELGLKNRCIDCGDEIHPQSTRCKICAARFGWEQGIYDAWSDGEIEILREQYPKLGKVEFIARGLLDRTPDAIRCKAKQLGLKNRCQDCGDRCSPDAMRCHSCASKFIHTCGDFDDDWNDTEVLTLRKKFSELGLARFLENKLLSRSPRAIAAKAQKLGLRNCCAECGTEIHPESMRCKSCAAEMRWEQGDLGNEEWYHKVSEAVRSAWERGVYTDKFQSPTGPERAIRAVLELLGVRYEFNTFRLESYTYDFFLPDYKVLIEYDGYYWHHKPGVVERDAIKDALAKEAGYRIVRLEGRENEDLGGAEIWSSLVRFFRDVKGETNNDVL